MWGPLGWRFMGWAHQMLLKTSSYGPKSCMQSILFAKYQAPQAKIAIYISNEFIYQVKTRLRHIILKSQAKSSREDLCISLSFSEHGLTWQLQRNQPMRGPDWFWARESSSLATQNQQPRSQFTCPTLSSVTQRSSSKTHAKNKFFQQGSFEILNSGLTNLTGSICSFAAFQTLCKLEGIVPALEASHALAFLSKLCPTMADGTRIVVNCSGRGDKDLPTVNDRLNHGMDL